jgi:dipeptidyl aminopeptidase/acylaminoacyl peptidase
MVYSRLSTRTVLNALFILLAATPVSAQPTLADYGALPTIQMMSVSPDGTTVAFRNHNPKRDVVLVYSLNEKKVLTGLDVTSIRPSQLYFLDHSRVIMVASADRFMRGYRGHHRLSSAFSLDVGSGEYLQLLTPGRNIIAGQTGLGNVLGASPDGTRVYMPAFTERRNFSQPDYSLMEVNLGKAHRPRMLKRGSPHTVDYFVDEKGNVLAEEVFNNHTNLHTIVAYHGDTEVEIYRDETEVRSISVVALTADRKSLIFQSESNGRLSYYAMSLADGAVTAPIFERADADVEAVLTDVNRIAYGVVYSGLTPSYEFFDDDLTELVKDLQAHFPGQSVWLRDATPDLGHLIVLVEGSSTSGDFYLFSGDGTLRFLGAARPEIGTEFVNPVIAYDYKARDGVVIPALVTVPRAHAEDPGNLPAVMLPHGGPEAHDWLGFDWFAQALASQGYAVIQPQFRGSSGFGLEHLLAGRGEWGKKSQEDITDALKDLVAEGLVDPERICIAGMSYGGFAALAGGAFTPDLYRCVVSVNGVSDVRKMLQQEKRDHGRAHWALAYWNEVIARGDNSRETLDTISPANFSDRFTAPVLLVHGDKDNVVDYDQSRHMQRQLKRAKKPVRLIKLEGEDHHLSDPATRLECLEAVVEFVNEHLGERTS